MHILLTLLFLFILISIAVFLIYVPIMIANSRGITGSKKTTIAILSWLGVFFGVTWIVALVLSLVWKGDALIDSSNLDKLEKLAKLYKDKIISKQEYESLKSKIISEMKD